MALITFGRFDDKIEFYGAGSIDSQKYRINSSNPNDLKKINYVPISTDGEFVLYDGCQIPLREFLSNSKRDDIGPLIVLTRKEREMILSALLDFKINISVFEKKFPIFDRIKYSSNPHKNYKVLKKSLYWVSTYNIYGGGLAKHYSTRYQFKVERKLRFKNSLDRYFAFAYRGGYQEVFKFKEERKGRVVIALDFNSMFVECMKGEFVEPKSIKYLNLRGSNANINDLPHGVYRVIFNEPIDDVFMEYHPFKFTTLNQSNTFKLDAHQNLELFLFKNEIEYYQRFFKSIEIIEGFASEKTIAHPLYTYSKGIYKKRLISRANLNKTLENFYKFQLVTTHSSTNPIMRKRIRFRTGEELIAFFQKTFSIYKPGYISIDTFIEIIKHEKYFQIRRGCTYYELIFIDFSNNNALYSLSSQVLANSRLKIVKLIERMKKIPTLEICYINTDSMHVSISRSEYTNFMKGTEDIISDKIGDLKVQAVGNKGYWFDVGRYWIFNDDKVEAFANIGFNHSGSDKTFLHVRKKVIHYKTDAFNFVKSYFSSLVDSFSYKKRLVGVSNSEHMIYNRFSFDEIKSISAINESITTEIFNSKLVKSRTFNYISSKY
jgi:hypothetical protein